MAENRVIGRGGDLPWRLPADMARFRTLTMGKPIVMGRRTHESIGRPLDGRLNIVVTRRSGYRAPGCTVTPSLEAAFEAAASAEPGTGAIAVIGGASIYAATLADAVRIHLTLVHASIDGDVRFPVIDPGAWTEVSRVHRPADARNPYDVSFIELIDRSPDMARGREIDAERPLDRCCPCTPPRQADCPNPELR